MRGEPFTVLLFDVGGRRYALPAADVQQIVRAVAIAPLPHAPAVVEGVINLRGQLVAVLDIRSRFRLPPRPLEYTDHFIVARAAQRLVALRVDRALDLVRLHPADVADVRDVVPGAGHVAQAAKLPEGLVLIHDLQTFLSQAESATLDEALAETGQAGGPP